MISNLKKENLDIKYKLDSLTGENFAKELSITHLNEKINQLSLENYEVLLINLKEKIHLYQNQLKESEKNRENLQMKLQNVIDNIQSINLCPNCEILENNISKLSNEIYSLQLDLKDLEHKNSDGKKSFIIDDIDNFDERHKDSDLSSKIMQLMIENKCLKSQLSNFESNSANFDEVDEALKIYPELFNKISFGQYTYNNIKVNIFLENNMLACRIGNTMPIQEFISSFFNLGSNSTTPGDNSFKENPKVLQEITSEVGECSYVSEEDKKDEYRKRIDKNRQVVIKKQFRPDKKVFAPLRQSSAHMERKKLAK